MQDRRADILIHQHTGNSLALLDAEGRTCSYADLAVRMEHFRTSTTASRICLVLCCMERSVDGVAAYLAALCSDHVVFPIDTGVAVANLAAILTRWRPEFLLLPAACAANALATAPGYRPVANAALPGFALISSAEPAEPDVHAGTALLLRTSGTLGEPKVVRLSSHNILSNAGDIAAVMHIGAADRGITSLPLDFSYGLSILHSHLAAGASVLITKQSPETGLFWRQAGRYGVSTVCLVPSSCNRLLATGWSAAHLPLLRLVCQAGGALHDEAKLALITRLQTSRAGLAAMYGQTEATARMTYLPPELARERLGSVGRPVPSGCVRLKPLPGNTNEIIYEGGNVMLGYARDRNDLGLGDERHGILETGDLGWLADDYLFVTGRRDRMVKLSGRRLQLEDVEAWCLSTLRDAAAIMDEDVLRICTSDPSVDPVRLKTGLAHVLGISPASVAVRRLASLPLTRSGKIDLAHLSATTFATKRPTIQEG